MRLSSHKSSQLVWRQVSQQDWYEWRDIWRLMLLRYLAERRRAKFILHWVSATDCGRSREKLGLIIYSTIQHGSRHS